MSIRLVVGLGNPGDAYLDTPHNIGFKFINALVKASSTDVVKKKIEVPGVSFNTSRSTL